MVPTVVKFETDPIKRESPLTGYMENNSNFVDCSSETANMYGCEPCPKCKSKFRCSFSAVIVCDDCGFEEGAVFSDDF